MLLEMRLYGYILLYFRQHVARYVDSNFYCISFVTNLMHTDV